MANGWRLANKPEVVQAFGDGERILFFVLGQKPTPCFEVRIVLGPEDIWPPIFNLEWMETGEVCPDVITGYYLVTCLPLGKTDYVTLRYEEGTQRVDVQPVDPTTLNGACEQAGGSGAGS
jgi:hypothetical protein